MLIDEVKIKITAGKGGDGSSSLRHDGQTAKGGPDGGNGGNGGSIYFIGVTDLSVLSVFRYKKALKAEDGINGSKQNMYGRNGKDLSIQVPLGTRITDLKTKRQYEINDITTPVLVARGGVGGRGNNEFKSATNQTPRYAENGTFGQEKKILLELRLIADIGLVGLPNAGKSSLLHELTNASPKIGDYPFTTLEPNIGMMGNIGLADIPGLIEGASSGKGLGIKFLKHIEKTKLLLHCIDAVEMEPLKNYTVIRNEFSTYNPLLLEKKEVILLTKTDKVDKKTLDNREKQLKTLNKDILFVSIYDLDSINSLRKYLVQSLQSL
jgi:GTP-binding protein